jgi:hypothetical protein
LLHNRLLHIHPRFATDTHRCLTAPQPSFFNDTNIVAPAFANPPTRTTAAICFANYFEVTKLLIDEWSISQAVYFSLDNL